MSRAEQYSWASLAALAAVFWWFQMRMLDGFAIVEQSASELLEVYFAVIALSTILEIVIASVLGTSARRKGIEKDERDHSIDARANQYERVFIIVAVNVIIWQALWEGAMEGHRLPHVGITNLPTLFFALFTTLFAGEIVKRVTTIILYRAQSARS